MRIAIMQPYFLPYLGYFQLIHAVDEFILFDDVNFINKGHINRNRILSGKQAQMFTLPLIKASQNKRINEIDIDLENKIFSKLLTTIRQSYTKAPQFEYAFPIIEEIFSFSNSNLAAFISNSLNVVCNYIGIETVKKVSTASFQNDHLKGQNRILDICHQNKATHYTNAIGGKELYDAKFFESNGITLEFIEMKNISYDQWDNPFVPNLSIIDVMMFNSKEQIGQLLNQYKIIK